MDVRADRKVDVPDAALCEIVREGDASGCAHILRHLGTAAVNERGEHAAGAGFVRTLDQNRFAIPDIDKCQLHLVHLLDRLLNIEAR